jgi:4-pyridoxolactonase
VGIKVYLLESGTLVLDQLFMTWNHGAGKEVRFPVFSIFVDHPQGKVLIDTGFDKAWVERILPFEKPEQSDEQKIVNQLARIGVRPEDVDIVVNSHLHFDHCSGNRYFPGAHFIMTKEELRHAFVPDPWERLGYDRNLVDMPGTRLTLLEPLGDGEYEVLPGITLIETPGHSKGHLSVIVQPTNDQPMVFPIDVAYGAHNLYDRVLMGLHSDPEDLLRSMQRVEHYARKLQGRIFFSHDPDDYQTYKKAPEFYGE